jgi:sugar phosphate permease
MSTAAVTYKLFGISMRRRAARRRLVVLTYIALGIVCALTSWLAQHNAWTYGYGLYAAVAVGIFIFGGQGRFGLVKPFVEQSSPNGRDPIDRLVFPDPVELNLNPRVAAAGTPLWHNDERELARRDAAHYKAFQPLGLALIAILMLSAAALHPPRWFPLDALLSLIFVIALFASMLAVTLPAAIILWTEPDLD